MSKSSYNPVRFQSGDGEGETLTIRTLEDVKVGTSISFILKAGTTQEQAQQLIDNMNCYIIGSSVTTD